MYTVLLPPSGNPLAVNKYIISYQTMNEEAMARLGPQRHKQKGICKRYRSSSSSSSSSSTSNNNNNSNRYGDVHDDGGDDDAKNRTLKIRLGLEHDRTFRNIFT